MQNLRTEKTKVSTFGDVAEAFGVSLQDIIGTDAEGYENEELYECNFTEGLSKEEIGEDAYLVEDGEGWFVVETAHN